MRVFDRLEDRTQTGADKAGAFAPTMPTFQLQPLVPPQVLHFMQVPLRTSV